MPILLQSVVLRCCWKWSGDYLRLVLAAGVAVIIITHWGIIVIASRRGTLLACSRLRELARPATTHFQRFQQ